MNQERFGRKLREYRAKRGWSIMQCSEKIGISEKYLADIERGDKVPRLVTLVKMLNTLSASADDVLQDSLTIGYIAKSNDLLKKLNSLDFSQRRQVLSVFESVIESLRKER